jgi:flagellar basal body-associated protein FliL
MTEISVQTVQIPPKTPGKNKKILLIGLLVLLLLAGAVSVYGYTSWDWFKSARQVYLETESDNCQALLDSLDNAFKTIEADYKPFLEESVHTTQNITANISTGTSQLDPQTEFILGVLQRSKITLDYSQDPEAKQSTAKIDLSVNGASPITLQTF